MNQHVKKVMIGASFIVASIGLVYAENKEKENQERLNAITQAKISITQAITAAEQSTSGKAVKAKFKKTKEGWVYEVDVINNNHQEFEVKVDADKGNVLSSKQEKADRDHDD